MLPNVLHERFTSSHPTNISLMEKWPDGSTSHHRLDEVPTRGGQTTCLFLVTDADQMAKWM